MSPNLMTGQIASILVRPMATDDLEGVGEIEFEAFGESAWAPRAFHEELRSNRIARYYVIDLEDGGPLVGYVGCWALPDAVHLVTIGVRPKYQRQGFGEILVLRALDLAYELGTPEVTLECRESNTRAHALYEKYSFVQNGRRPRYYQDTREAAIIMTATDVCSNHFRQVLGNRRSQLQERHQIQIAPTIHSEDS